ncbi:hypothetical protein BJV82DRAFT_513051 [Fennellomyces sp. T-0311]|nr:hypothetical protein BJV82DRAFT_513051 [Fennellomyces sp. T-0311]
MVETPSSLSPSQPCHKIRQSTGSLASLPSVVSSVSSCSTFPSLATDDLRESSDEEISSSITVSNTAQRLARAASMGDIHTMKSILRDHPYVDLNQADELGVTPLIHATYFDQIEAIRVLLDAGAIVDQQDKKGWTALMWAVSNQHVETARFLLDRGASCDIQTSGGHSIHRYLQPDDDTMAALLPPKPIKKPEPKPKLKKKTKKQRRASTVPLDQVDLIYYQADMYGYAAPQSQKKPPVNDDADDEYESSEEEEDLEGWEACIRSIFQFDWTKCLPDQMFVFCHDDMSHIIDTVVNEVKLPLVSQDDARVPSDAIFLCCRYAHYHARRDLLQAFLSLSINKITKAIKANTKNIDNLAFWISNAHRLYLYLRRDEGLADVTIDEQQQLSQVISEAYSYLVSFCQKRLDKLIEPALLDYEEIGEQIDFVSDSSWQRFFRRSSTSSTTSSNNSRPNSFLLTTPNTPPSVITSLLDSVIATVDAYEIHTEIKQQLLMQLLQFTAAQGINRLLSNKKYLCRSKAIHVRMNVSALEEWIRHTLGHSVSYFQAMGQLLQLLQCVSQLHDLKLFQDTVTGFDLLSSVQIRRCVLNYRYEVGEPQLPEAVEAQVQDEDMGRLSMDIRTSTDSFNELTFVTPNTMLKRDRHIVPTMPEVTWLTKLDKK